MTVMIDRFFGLHQQVIRSGLWKKMRPGEKDLYVFLMHKSERHCTRELRCTDMEIDEAIGVKPRTLCNARKKLEEHGLIRCLRRLGNRYEYVLCDPATRQPYPGNPKQAVLYAKKGKETASQDLMEPQRFSVPVELKPSCSESLEQHGLPGVFA